MIFRKVHDTQYSGRRGNWNDAIFGSNHPSFLQGKVHTGW